ncbi:GGDEF domain-containing protein [Colwelliaceae bacterium 6441]
MIKGFNLVNLSLMILLTLPSGYLSAQAQQENDSAAKNQTKGLLEVGEPLPVNARILSLLALSKTNQAEALLLLPKINDISENFNVAEKYLMLLIRANILIDKNQEEKIIDVLEEALLLAEKIPSQQIVLPEFNQVHFLLAQSYAKLEQFKLAYDQKKTYMQKYHDYRVSLREERLTKLNNKYKTDLKVKENEFLVTQQKFKQLQLADAEKETQTQHRNIVILVITAIVFALLLFRQLKIRTILQKLSKTDSLTQLFNRRTLFEQGEMLVASALKRNSDISVILLDIDYFKSINDNYGHDVGDNVIKAIADLGRESMRPRDVFARLGGEEFAVILPDTSHDQARAIAEHFREKVEQYQLINRQETIKTTVSLGVSSLQGTIHNFDDLLNAADEAMYRAKSAGRNHVCSYNQQDT